MRGVSKDSVGSRQPGADPEDRPPAERQTVTECVRSIVSTTARAVKGLRRMRS